MLQGEGDGGGSRGGGQKPWLWREEEKDMEIGKPREVKRGDEGRQGDDCEGEAKGGEGRGRERWGPEARWPAQRVA